MDHIYIMTVKVGMPTAKVVLYRGILKVSLNSLKLNWNNMIIMITDNDKNALFETYRITVH